MTLLSVNLNKIALLRNSRGGGVPDLQAFAEAAIAAGVRGLTVHPRADARHITLDDVVTVSRLAAVRNGSVEFNIEGDLRAELIRLVETVRPHQFTVVPVTPGEVTSYRGWRAYDDHAALADVVKRLDGIRIATFCDAAPESCQMAISCGVQAIELYTGPYAHAFARGTPNTALSALAAAGAQIKDAGLRLNGGHDLTLENVPPLLARVPFDEFSIGHQLTVDALTLGWIPAIQCYLAAVEGRKTKAD
jgi:pyridoxine 5-phosphate synthase